MSDQDDVDEYVDTAPIPPPKKSIKSGRGKGYVADHKLGHDKSKDPSIRHLLGASLGEPPEASLEGYISEVWDQHETGSCTGHAFGRAAQLRLLAIASEAGITLNVPKPSVTAIYQAGVAADRSSPNAPLQDDGAAPSQVVRGMATQGVPPDSAWPPGGFEAAYAADPVNHKFVTEEPDLFELEKASTFVLQGFYRIEDGSDQTTKDVVQALASGYPVAVGVEVDQAFEDQNGTRVCPPCGPNPLGGHMLCVVGYRTNAQGGKEFRVCNSWGPNWADNGLFWASAAWLKSATDVYAITVAPK